MVNELLSTNPNRPIERIGDTVHRPAHYWTPAVHDLLNYLRSVGFKYSPRVLGFDDDGREVLSYIDGQSGKVGWYKILSDEGLKKFAKLLSNYHDAVKDYKPDETLEWAYAKGSLQPGQIICHGDFGPWNIVWQGDEPVGIVDWDLVVPDTPRYDVLYALQYAAPFRDDKTTIEFHHFEAVPDRKHRIEVFAEAYGITGLENIADDMAAVIRKGGEYEKQLADRGVQPQVEWVANGALDDVERQAHWVEENRVLFD